MKTALIQMGRSSPDLGGEENYLNLGTKVTRKREKTKADVITVKIEGRLSAYLLS